jgi:hypothetical protein
VGFVEDDDAFEVFASPADDLVEPGILDTRERSVP